MLEHAIFVGYEALDNTINQNPVLKKAGVIDAGGKGYLYILEGMLKALRGEILSYSQKTTAGAEKADFGSFNTQEIRFTYCTEFSRSENRRDVIICEISRRTRDSIVVVEDD